MKRTIIFLVIVFATIDIQSQVNSIFSEASEDIRTAKKLKRENKVEESLNLVKSVRLKLTNSNSFNDSSVFNDYFSAVMLESDIYEDKGKLTYLSEFQLEESNRVKPLIRKYDYIAQFYFFYKDMSFYNFMLGNNYSFDSQKKAVNGLTALLYELNSVDFKDKITKNEIRQRITKRYFSVKLSSILKIPESQNNSLESLHEVNQKLRLLLMEANSSNFKYYEGKENSKSTIELNINSNIEAIKYKELEENKFQSFLKDSKNLKRKGAFKMDADYFNNAFSDLLGMYATGMYYQEVTGLKKLSNQIFNSTLSVDDYNLFITLNYQINNILFSLYYVLKDYENAMLYLNKSNEFYKKLPKDKRNVDSDIAYYTSLSSLYYTQGEYDKALEESFKVIEINSEFSGYQNLFISAIYYKINNYPKAIEWTKKYINFINKYKTYDIGVSALMGKRFLGLYLLANNNANEAKIHLGFVLNELTKEKGYSKEAVNNLKSQCLLDLGILESKMNNLKIADESMIKFAESYIISYFESLLVFTEDMRGEDSFEEFNGTNSLFYFISQRTNDTGKIVSFGYNYALLTKQLLLNTAQTIRNNASINDIPELKEINDKWKLVSERLKEVEVKNKDSLLDYARVYEKEIVARGKKSILQLFENSKIEWTDVRNNLNENEVALEFINFTPYDFENNNKESYYGVFILKKDSEYPQFINLFKDFELNKIINSVVLKDQSIKDEMEELYNDKGIDLFNLIWQPLEKHLIGIKKVYFSPSGMLHNITFSAIPINKSKNLLGEKYKLVQLGSTKSIANSKSTHTYRNAALFGDIDYDYSINKLEFAENQNLRRSNRGSDFNNLPGTKKEIEEIEKILLDNNIKSFKYTKNRASEKNLTQAVENKPDILHIGTHAFYLKPINDEFFMTDMIGFAKLKGDEDPMNRSGLAFANANYFWKFGDKILDNDDGILTANEMSTLDMKGINLAVLSACETALGASVNNEGVFGLQRGLKMAGVKNLLLSLWKVDDKITQEYMIEFYKNLFTKKLTIEEAYFKTQGVIKKKYKNPYYWAAFILIR